LYKTKKNYRLIKIISWKIKNKQNIFKNKTYTKKTYKTRDLSYEIMIEKQTQTKYFKKKNLY